MKVLQQWGDLEQKQNVLKNMIKEADASLDKKAYEKYPQLSVDEIKTLVVNDKWLTTIAASVRGELDLVSQTLADPICQLAKRYATPLPQQPMRDYSVEILELGV